MQPTDVTNPKQVVSAFEHASKTLGPIDILVNCAGMAPTAPFHKIEFSQWQATLDLNLNGVFHCSQQALPTMREQQWGRIINIASTGSLKGYKYVCRLLSHQSMRYWGLPDHSHSRSLRLALRLTPCAQATRIQTLFSNLSKPSLTKTGRSEAVALTALHRLQPHGPPD